MLPPAQSPSTRLPFDVAPDQSAWDAWPDLRRARGRSSAWGSCRRRGRHRPATQPSHRGAGGSPDEAASPVIAVLHAVLIFQQKRQIHLALRKRSGDIVPVAHQEPQDFVSFGKSAERMGLGRLAAEHLRHVFAGHHDFGTCNQGREKPIDLLDVHSLAAFVALQEFVETVQFGFRQRLILGKDCHSVSHRSRLRPIVPPWIAESHSPEDDSTWVYLREPGKTYRVAGYEAWQTFNSQTGDRKVFLWKPGEKLAKLIYSHQRG